MTPHEQLNTYIKAHHLRRSREREDILNLIIELDAHFSTQSLYNNYESRGQHIALASFYNAIDFLQQASIIIKHPFAGAEQQYELRERAATHHHRICTECGAIKEFTDQKINRSVNARHFNAFDTHYHSIYLYGICSKCQNKDRKTEVARHK